MDEQTDYPTQINSSELGESPKALTKEELDLFRDLARRGLQHGQISMGVFLDVTENSVNAGGTMEHLVEVGLKRAITAHGQEDRLDIPLEEFERLGEQQARLEWQSQQTLEKRHERLIRYTIAYSKALHGMAGETVARLHPLLPSISTTTLDAEGKPEYFCQFYYRYRHSPI